MTIDYKVLSKLLECNKNLKLQFRNEDNNNLDIIIYNKVISSIVLNNNNIEENSEIIYNHIINLENITLYIPKIYIKK